MFPVLLKLGPVTLHTYGFMMAVGVASPNAQGQAITSTVTAATKPVCVSPAQVQPRKVTTAIQTTTGTNTADILFHIRTDLAGVVGVTPGLGFLDIAQTHGVEAVAAHRA